MDGQPITSFTIIVAYSKRVNCLTICMANCTLPYVSNNILYIALIEELIVNEGDILIQKVPIHFDFKIIEFVTPEKY